MREKIAEAIKKELEYCEICESHDCDCEDNWFNDAAYAILALEVPVWCDFYGRKCTGNICAVSAKPESCSHKSTKTIADLIGGPDE